MKVAAGCLIVSVFAFLFSPLLLSQSAPKVTFMEPDAMGTRDGLPVFGVVTNVARAGKYQMWLNNEAARMALPLFSSAWKLAPPKGADSPVLHIAIVPGGNRADAGFCIKGGNWVEPHPDVPYLVLDGEEASFAGPLLHETGRLILLMMNRGKGLAKRVVSSVPHSPASLTDRATAFETGFAIHLETTIAHLALDPGIVERYKRGRFMFGANGIQAEYHRPTVDLISYEQTRSRYHDVVENTFAFAPAFRGPDYLRVQLERSRDVSTLRDANQLLQSPGFHASVFFGLLARGEMMLRANVVAERHEKILAVLASTLSTQSPDPDNPLLLAFIEAYLKKYPAEAGEVVDVLMDLSHGVFVDRQAAILWREYYLEALHADPSSRKITAIEEARKRWRAGVLKDPASLRALLGPQIRCEVSGKSVNVNGPGKASPLSFDVNTVEYGIMLMIPDITAKEADSWLKQRAEKPFTTPQDFTTRSGLRQKSLKHLKLGG